MKFLLIVSLSTGLDITPLPSEFECKAAAAQVRQALGPMADGDDVVITCTPFYPLLRY